MAAGLFASLFAASSSASSAAASSAQDKASHQASNQSTSDSDAPSEETEQQHSPLTPNHDVDMPGAPPTKPSSSTVAASTHPASPKEAQDVADIDMQLSSPPSSPPPSAPHTPHDASSGISLAEVRSLSSSGSGRPASFKSPSSTPAPERAPAAGRGVGSSSTPTVQRASRRRTMPARLSQVSSLLAGSMLEEELLLLETPSSPSGSSFQHSNLDGVAQPASDGKQGADASSHPRSAATNFLSASSVIVLTSDARLLARAIYPNAPSTETVVKSEQHADDLSSTAPTSTPSKPADAVGCLRPPPASSSSSSLVSTLAIKRQQLIETPDFKQRDDTLYMPKTRGLRSEAAEDTSDAAYERRHRKPETAERRQRKAEVDRLSRDRQKLLSRIDQLKTVEARMLQPIVVARDQVRAEASGRSQDASPPPASAVKPLSERIEDVRKELLDDAYDTLKRYDLLLSISADAKPASPGPSTLASKAESSAAVEDDASRSQSPRLKIRIKAGRATWETADSASPTSKHSPSHNEKETVSRRVSARQPKHRVESLPTPLTAAAVEAVEHSRRKRQRRSGSQVEEESSTPRKASAAQREQSPTKGRKANESESPERRTRRRGSPEVGGTYKGKSIQMEQEGQAASARAIGRPQRAAAAAAAVASARQRKYAERSFSDFDYDDEDGEVESALEDVDMPDSTALGRRASNHSIRRSPNRPRDQRSPSASSVTSSASSLASSLGYMYPTVAEAGSLKVSQSLAEIQASDPEATSSSPVLSASDAPNKGEGARKRLKLVLSRSPSIVSGLGETKKVLTEALDDDAAQVSNGKGRALTESEAESILAAFLGTTPVGKSAKVEEPVAASTSTAAAAAAAAKEKANATIASKRRSTRRETTQSFGEKLPDLLTKTAQFDFSVMEYLRSIDKPRRDNGGG